MNIGIDGYEANVVHRVGIGQYAFQLLWQFYKLDNQNRYTIFLPHEPLSDMPPIRLGWKYVVGRPGNLWTIQQLPNLIKPHQLQLFFSPTHYIPWFTAIPRLMSIMDLSFLHYPEMFRKKDLWQLKHLTQFSVKRARKIFTISEFSKNEIHAYYKYPLEDITVTYPGVTLLSETQNTQDKKEATLKKFGITNKYILFVGTIQPRKNITRLIRAFELLKAEYQLVLVGKKGWLYEPIMADAQELISQNKALFLDFVSTQDLQLLYQCAACFVLPSLYEGFGLPVIEALHEGCPVVVSQNSSLPEVTGEAGIYVNPMDVADIANGIIKAVQLTAEEREKRKQLGLAYIKKFNWENCAKKTLEVFDSLV